MARMPTMTPMLVTSTSVAPRRFHLLTLLIAQPLPLRLFSAAEENA
jgi:hypothetical protein